MELVGTYRRDMERRGLRPQSIYSMVGQVRTFARAMEPKGLFEVSAEDVERFLDGRRITARTRYCWLSSLHCFYSWAVRFDHADLDPTEDIVRPKLRKTLPRPVSDADLQLALDCAPTMEFAWITLAAFGGLRCGEIAGLHGDDIMWDMGMLHVEGKGGRHRMVPMHQRVDHALRVHGPRRRGPVFTRALGGAWPPAALSRHGNLYLDSIGVDATMHQFRHWFGTRTYAQSKDIRVVQELMGHSSPSTAAIYVAFSEAASREAVNGLDLRRPEEEAGTEAA